MLLRREDLQMCPLISNNDTKLKRHVVYDRIKEEIINNKLEPGTLLVERRLCEALNTSRTPVREALQQLANEGLADFIGGRGVVVSQVTYESVIDIYNIREVLEGLTSRLCAMHIDSGIIKVLEETYEKREEAIAQKDYKAIIEYDIEFHQAIINNSGSEKLKNLISNIQDQIKRITYSGSSDEEIIRASQMHKAIFEAIKNQDGETAEQLMRQHVRESKQTHIEKMRYGK
jgi:DNA-binding GntR family transcriptional regulator